MKKISIHIVMLLIAVLISGYAYSQNTIQGKVMNVKGVALNKSSIAIPSLGISVITGDDGAYSFTNIPNGRYSVEASHSGFESDVEIVTLSGGQTATTEFKLGSLNKNIKEVVVTGVSGAKSSLESSISITSLSNARINNSVARTTAEIFRSIPGIRSESSGGDGNSNITVRGVPVSAGGSRYMLLQEDGLPVLQFGDMAFATQDQFLRFDNTVNKVEAVRGGSASVLASNSPAGIINFISKTGETEGGSIATNIGLNYKNARTDFEFGAPIGNNLFFHVGGFYRTGDGPRRTGYTSNNGGQIKANITKKFSNGFARIYVKALNDRTAAYMPMPIQVSGTNASPVWESLANYSAFNGALQSRYLTTDRTIGGDNSILTSDVTDGMHSKTNAIGAEFSFNLENGWKVSNKARMAFNNGQFLAPFPANAYGSFADFKYSDTSGGRSPYANPTYAGTTTSVTGEMLKIHLFNTKLNNFNNYTNDISVAKNFGKEIKVNAGLYKAIQNVNMDWHWNTYLMEAKTSNDSLGMRLIDVTDTSGNAMTTNGQLAYGVPAWGNCCSRRYDTKYDITAPYASVELAPTDNLNIELGMRYDMGQVSGNFSGANGKTATIDMNGNGTIDANESNVAVMGGTPTPVNYSYNILSYSFGANYQLDKESSVFIRTSKGGSASADRVLFSGYNYVGDNDKKLDAQKVNTVAQTELGYKVRKQNYTLNATGFYAVTKESNYEATTQKKVANNYRSLGLELDGSYNVTKDFNIRGGFTYTNAKITAAMDTSIINKIPRRLPAVMFNITPSYSIMDGRHSIGVSVLGVTSSYAQDGNKLKMPGYVVVNPYVNINIVKNLNFNLAANNLFNALGITESEEGAITEGVKNIVRARPITGRSISAGLRYNF
jgi:outer membrane receptor protein involved in Fe transport